MIQEMVQKEYEKANLWHGLLHSEHEGYAVLLEEIEEVKEELENITAHMEEMWQNIRGNTIIEPEVRSISTHAEKAINELIQVMSVSKRLQEYLGYKEAV